MPQRRPGPYPIESYVSNQLARFEAQCLFDEAWRCAFLEGRRYRSDRGLLCLATIDFLEERRARSLPIDTLLILLPPSERRKVFFAPAAAFAHPQSRVTLRRVWRHRDLLRLIQRAYEAPIADDAVEFLRTFTVALDCVAGICALSSRKMLIAATNLGLHAVKPPQVAAPRRPEPSRVRWLEPPARSRGAASRPKVPPLGDRGQYVQLWRGGQGHHAPFSTPMTQRARLKMENENDLYLREQILKELEWEPSVNAEDIGVAARRGVITLSGHVSNYIEKVAAERAARRVRGVRAIVQEIQVCLDDGSVTPDETIAARAAAIIMWQSKLPGDKIKVAVENGWITLTGHVDWQFQREAVEHAVHRLIGVTGVTNLIVVRSKPQPGDVRQQIEDAFRRNAILEARRVNVQVEKDGRIQLIGRVQTWQERRAAERAAWSAPGVRQVEDHISIG